MKNKRGGQPGNLNALKHGFYSSGIRAETAKQLDEVGSGLMDEIGLIRSIIQRVAELARDETDRRELLELLDTIGAAGVRLGSMLRTQKLYFDGGGLQDVGRLLAAALGDAWEEIENEH